MIGLILAPRQFIHFQWHSFLVCAWRTEWWPSLQWVWHESQSTFQRMVHSRNERERERLNMQIMTMMMTHHLHACLCRCMFSSKQANWWNLIESRKEEPLSLQIQHCLLSHTHKRTNLPIAYTSIFSNELKQQEKRKQEGKKGFWAKNNDKSQGVLSSSSFLPSLLLSQTHDECKINTTQAPHHHHPHLIMEFCLAYFQIHSLPPSSPSFSQDDAHCVLYWFCRLSIPLTPFLLT